MRISELMVGDWVKLKPIFAKRNGLYQKIVAINNIENYISFINRYGELIEVGFCCIEPIQVSEEILLLSKFDKNESFFVFEGDDYHIQFVIRPNFNKLHIIKNNLDNTNDVQLFKECLYVHEVQRALRMCDLWELANNFKMEGDTNDRK